MLAVNYSTMRNKLKDFCDAASDLHETVIVTRKNEKNVVLMSLDKYNELERAAKNAEYVAKLNSRMTQLSNGEGHEHELIEVD